MPLHSSIQERCRKIGFSNLAPIIWHKIANATYEVGGNSRFLGKPYEPNGVIKNDIEYILMLRKAAAKKTFSFGKTAQYTFRSQPQEVVPTNLERHSRRIHKESPRPVPPPASDTARSHVQFRW